MTLRNLLNLKLTHMRTSLVKKSVMTSTVNEESEDECSEEEYEYEESEMEYEDEESETEYDDEGSEEEYQDEESEEEYQDEESDEEYEAHRLNSNQNNPNNDEYWRLRGWSQRPDDWRGSCSKIIEIFLFFAICRAHLRELAPVQTKSAQREVPPSTTS
jgi:hypothetical protein